MDRQELAKQLEQVRLKKDLTYDALSREVGISSHALRSNILGIHPRPQARTLYKIEQYLKRVGSTGRRKSA